jgi:hypothetical protein
MNLLERSSSTIKAMLSDDDRSGIRGCIWATWEKLKDHDILDQTGVDQSYLTSILGYFRAVRDQGNTDDRCQSPTLILIKVNEEEYHLTMSREDAKLISKCLEIALHVVPDWEFHILLGVHPYEVRDLLTQFHKLL